MSKYSKEEMVHVPEFDASTTYEHGMPVFVHGKVCVAVNLRKMGVSFSHKDACSGWVVGIGIQYPALVN